jgi:hypothetical protein
MATVIGSIFGDFQRIVSGVTTRLIGRRGTGAAA